VRQDERQRLVPGLAESWRTLEDGTWEFRLRRGVKFHDGSDFTAEDVAATLARVPRVPNSPSSFALYTRAVGAVEIVDPHTVRLRTAQRYPLLATDLSLVPIVSAGKAEASTEAFNSGAAAIGTGPYRVLAFRRGQAVELAANEGHWEGKPGWDRVELRIVTNGVGRVAALLAGDLHLIEAPPPATLADLRARPEIAISATASNKVVFLFPDTGRGVTPFALDAAGKPIEPNPLKNLRVRRAISKAIDRAALARQVMENEAIPTGQLVPEGFFGASPRLRPEPFDPDGARRLLAEAGFPGGFALTLHGPNDRFLNDGPLLVAIATMLARVGIDARAETMPWSVFATRASKPEFSLFLVAWGAGTGEASSPLRGLLATFDPTTGLGASNRGRWSNAVFDRTLQAALATIDDARRETLLQRATEFAMDELGLIPLHHEMATWAMHRAYRHRARTDQYTQAMDVTPAR
jgi:peptide/nickel transport system substrate-binding protein